MHPFRKFISNYTSISNTEWELVAKSLTKKVYKKEKLILEEGKICRHIYFLERGFLRYYSLRNGEESTKFFTQAPYCFTAQRSFNQQEAARESIETLEESIIWQINREEALALLGLNSWSEFVRKLVQEVQYYTQEILEDLQSNTAEERYRRMLYENSILTQKVPLKHLASYLGIAPQSLSRIRKNLTLENRS